MIPLFTGVLTEIAVIGAHCDDIAIGMGGTLLALATTYPGLRVRGLVLAGAGTERETEEVEALSAFCPAPTFSWRSLTYQMGERRHIGIESSSV